MCLARIYDSLAVLLLPVAQNLDSGCQLWCQRSLALAGSAFIVRLPFLPWFSREDIDPCPAFVAALAVHSPQALDHCVESGDIANHMVRVQIDTDFSRRRADQIN